ncbi:alpha/beta hydrolase [Acidaminobacter hydrogenoformans]|uniref:Acetyl esterase/lipase n=1 Tax=Acidaminobacter hydrogenoformans DSM 2784 TaxID=1120920 RepID=A0A1G5RZP6_9FIRM|nr:alpha/beta hydrolase [Acidaminobacter hydrogenoformans]SCZ79615.1 Acetyl esterase/lipase [Acidaminobacter hydrogenoformans DSM 2784]
MITAETYSFQTFSGINLFADLYRTAEVSSPSKPTILYFHGGGLLYGTRDDLPEAYIQLLTRAGHNLISFDYPLAPESRLSVIIDTVIKAILWFTQHAKTTLQLSDNKYVLFGRSAGAYLCLLAASRIQMTEHQAPEAISAYYGYASLDLINFRTPSKHYLSFLHVDDRTVQSLIKPDPIAYAPIEQRFALYLYARQSGTWLNFLLNENDQVLDYALSDNELSILPPTFLAASTTDEDVPFKASKELSKTIPNSTLFTVYGLNHDFDRDLNNEAGIHSYQKLLEWLSQF